MRVSWKPLNFLFCLTAARRQALRLAARALEQRLNADLSGYVGPELPCSCGGLAQYHGRHDKTFESVLGPLREQNRHLLDLLVELNPHKARWDDYKLPFNYRYSRRLMALLEDKRVTENWDIMPHSRRAMLRVSKLTPGEFTAAVAEGVLAEDRNPSVERIEEWLRFRPGAPDEAKLTISFELQRGKYLYWQVEDALETFIKSGLSAKELNQAKFTGKRRSGYRLPEDDIEDEANEEVEEE